MILSMMMCMVLCGIDFPVRDTLPEAEESAVYAEAKAGPATLVVFWNLENFFDWEEDGGVRQGVHARWTQALDSHEILQEGQSRCQGPFLDEGQVREDAGRGRICGNRE